MTLRFTAALLATASVLPGAALRRRRPPPTRRPPAAQPAAQPVRYTARQFYETTSFGMAVARRHRFLARRPQPADQLATRAACSTPMRLPVAGGDPVQISQSTDQRDLRRSAISRTTTACSSPPTRAATSSNHVYVRARRRQRPRPDAGREAQGRASTAGAPTGGPSTSAPTSATRRCSTSTPMTRTSYERRLIFRNERHSARRRLARRPLRRARSRRNSSADSDVYLAEVGARRRAAADHRASGQCRLRRLRLHAGQPRPGLRHQRDQRVRPGLALRPRQRRAARRCSRPTGT